MKSIKTVLKTALMTSAYLFATTAQSATITQFGDDVSFTYDDATLFGTGTVVGNNIFFTPDAFLASSIDGIGPADFVTDTLNIDVVSTTKGFSMTDFLLHESGDYKLKGTGSIVTADAMFQVTSATNLFGCGGLCQDQFIADAGVLADTGGASALWSLGNSIDLTDTAGWGSDTSVNITLQNNLFADTTDLNDLAFIQKKFGAIGITVNQVPVPAAVWLFGSGLLGLVGVARRRK